MRPLDISCEYAAVNKIILFLILIIISLPFTCIIAERINGSQLLLDSIHCFTKAETGKPCPTCGLSRSILLLYKGHFQESMSQYAYGYLFVFLLFTQLVLRIIPFLSNKIWIPYMDITQMILCGIFWLFMIH